MRRLFNVILFFAVAAFPILPQSNDVIIIDLVNPHVESIPMSRFFTNVEYTPLATSESCVLKKNSNYYFTDQHIVGINVLGNAYLFDRKTGRFIRQIGRKGEGKGEEEYRAYPVDQYGFDEDNKILFFDDQDQWKGFPLEAGKKVIKVTKPKSGIIDNPYPFGKNNFIGYVSNTTGNVKLKLVVFDIKGKVLQTFPNYQTYKKVSPANTYTTFRGRFYNYNNKVYFKEAYNDTVFAVRSNTLEPHIIFNLGKNHIPYDALDSYSKLNNLYDIKFVKETSAYIFFRYVMGPASNRLFVNGYYDKKNKQTYICKTTDGKADFINDIDGFPAFNPQLITNQNKFLGVIWPEDLLNTAKNKINSRGLNIISRIKADDNPIIVTADLK